MYIEGIGTGTSDPNVKLDINGTIALPIKSVSSGYTLSNQDYTLLISGNTIITLPDTGEFVGVIYVIKKTDSSTSTSTVECTNGQFIDGINNFSLTSQNQKISVQSNGYNWFIIG